MPVFDMTSPSANYKFLRPELLRHPQIPSPMATVAPRIIEGPDWWNEVRVKAYGANNYHCWACGATDRLEAHEVYVVDYSKATLTFVEVTALCPMCHNFIHCGRLTKLMAQRKITRPAWRSAIKHGIGVLTAANLQAHWGLRPVIASARYILDAQGDDKWLSNVLAHVEPPPRLSATFPEWSAWRMIYNGKAYPPRYTSELEAQRAFADIKE